MKKYIGLLSILLCVSFISGCADYDDITIEESASTFQSTRTSLTVSSIPTTESKQDAKTSTRRSTDSRVSAQSSNTTTGKTTDALDAKRKSIEKAYKIKLLYGDETYWDFDDFNMLKLNDKTYIKIGLADIEKELKRYPPGFFAELSRELRIFMITSISREYSGMAYYGNSGYFALYLSTTSNYISTLHHELMHMIDFTMEEKSGYSGFQKWRTFNPPGFAYTGQDSNPNNYVYDGVRNIGSCYFVSNYSQKSEQEDRAEIFSDLMMNNNLEMYRASNNPILLKINYLISEIRRVFKTVQKVDKAAWE